VCRIRYRKKRREAKEVMVVTADGGGMGIKRKVLELKEWKQRMPMGPCLDVVR